MTPALEWTGWALIELGDWIDLPVITPWLVRMGQAAYRRADG